MKLYGYYRSSTTYRVRIALNLKRLKYQTVPVNLLESEQMGEAYKTLNPFGSVPALEIGDRLYVQSMSILMTLDELYPAPALLPANTEVRKACRELSCAIATEVHAPNNLAVLKYLKSEFGADQDQIARWYATWIHRTFAPIEQRLASRKGTQGLPFGNAPSLFETLLIPQMYNARRFDVDMTRYPNLTRIEATCLAMSAFEKAHPDNQPDTPKS